MIQVFEACGKYSRTITVNKNIMECFECKKEKECLIFDSSDAEYSDIIFCKECLNSFFDGHISKSDYSNDLSGQECLE